MAILKRDVFDVWIEGKLDGEQLAEMASFLGESGKRIVTSDSGTSVFDISNINIAESIEYKLKKVFLKK